MKVINASAYGVYYMYTVPGESRMQTSHNDRAPYYSIYSAQVDQQCVAVSCKLYTGLRKRNACKTTRIILKLRCSAERLPRKLVSSDCCGYNSLYSTVLDTWQ